MQPRHFERKGQARCTWKWKSGPVCVTLHFGVCLCLAGLRSSSHNIAPAGQTVLDETSELICTRDAFWFPHFRASYFPKRWQSVSKPGSCLWHLIWSGPAGVCLAPAVARVYFFPPSKSALSLLPLEAPLCTASMGGGCTVSSGKIGPHHCITVLALLCVCHSADTPRFTPHCFSGPLAFSVKLFLNVFNWDAVGCRKAHASRCTA